MSREFRVDIETDWVGAETIEYFEMPDNATDEEIEDEAKEIFFNYCNYSVSEVEEQEEE